MHFLLTAECISPYCIWSLKDPAHHISNQTEIATEVFCPKSLLRKQNEINFIESHFQILHHLKIVQLYCLLNFVYFKEVIWPTYPHGLAKVPYLRTSWPVWEDILKLALRAKLRFQDKKMLNDSQKILRFRGSAWFCNSIYNDKNI